MCAAIHQKWYFHLFCRGRECLQRRTSAVLITTGGVLVWCRPYKQSSYKPKSRLGEDDWMVIDLDGEWNIVAASAREEENHFLVFITAKLTEFINLVSSWFQRGG